MSKIFELPTNQNKRETMDSALRTLALQNMRAENPLFEYLEFYETNGRSDKPEKNSSATGGKERNINSAFAENSVDTAYGDVNLKIVGDDVRTDIAWNRSGENEAISKHRQNVESVSKAIARHFINLLVNGDSGTDAKEFDGLEAQIAAAQTIDAQEGDGTGLQVLLGNSDAAHLSRQKAAELIENAIKLVSGQPSFALANGTLISRLKRAFPNQFTQIEVGGHTIDVFDNSVPFIDPGYNSDESAEILAFDETVSTDNDCTSIYVVRAGEREYATLATTLGLDVSAIQQAQNYIYNNIELDSDLALLSTKAAYRIKGFRK